MISHSVWVRFKSSVDQSQKKEVYGEILALKDRISGMTDVRHGQNISPEGLHGGFMDGFIVTFETVTARDAYLVHPDHLAVAEKIVAAAEGELSGILVFDMEI